MNTPLVSGPLLALDHGMSPSYRRAPIVWFLVFAAACASPASPTEMPDSAAAAAGGVSDVAGPIVKITNAERANAGLPALRTNGRLMDAAQLQADQMVRLGRLEHVLSSGQYPKPEDRLAAAGYQWSSYAENIAMGQTSAASVMDSWMRSSGHRANILSANNTEIGIGFARDSAGRPYYVQVFGKPR